MKRPLFTSRICSWWVNKDNGRPFGIALLPCPIYVPFSQMAPVRDFSWIFRQSVLGIGFFSCLRWILCNRESRFVDRFNFGWTLHGDCLFCSMYVEKISAESEHLKSGNRVFVYSFRETLFILLLWNAYILCIVQLNFQFWFKRSYFHSFSPSGYFAVYNMNYKS